MDINEISIVDSSFDGIEKAFNIIEKGIKVNYVTNNEYIFQSLKNGYVKNIRRKELVRYLINKEITIKKINECDDFSSIIFITRNMLENNHDEIEVLCKDIAEKIKKKTIIIYNGASFPGNVEEYIEKTMINFSNLEYKKDFNIGYMSPQIIDFKKIFLSENKSDETKKILKSFTDSLWPEYEKIYFQYIKDAEAANIISIILNEINLITYFSIIFLSKYFNYEEKQILEIFKIKPRKILDEENYLNIIKNFIFQENKKFYDIKLINHYEKICKNIF
jgi:UDP-N-acetyl-D-mannosaminuronate dehydrogenase